MKRKYLLIALISVQLVSLIFLTPVLIKTTQYHINENKIIAEKVYDTISNTMSKSIVIAQSIACDNFLTEALKNEGAVSEKKMEEQMSAFLGEYKKRFGYESLFIVSEKTHRYYTLDGIACIVNPLDNPYDIWYRNFVDSGKDTAPDTDLDSVNDYRWTIFFNVRLTDQEGRFLGVCGTGILIDSLIETISEIEKAHGIKINLVDQDGLVQFDTDLSNIESVYIPSAVSDMATGEDFTYTERNSSVFRMTRFLPQVEWFLVIQRFAMHDIREHSATGFLTALLYLLLTASFILVLGEQEKFRTHDLIKAETSLDPLTSLPNRNYVCNSFGEQGIFNTTRYRSLAVLDVDQFKSINETRDGDEILKKVVEISLTILHEGGLMFRWSGDEFVFFLEWDSAESERKFKTLCEMIKNELQITVSVGLVSVDLTVSIKTNYHRAAEQCLIMKEKGGNGVSRLS